MQRGAPTIVGPATHQITQIDDEGVFLGPRRGRGLRGAKWPTRVASQRLWKKRHRKNQGSTACGLQVPFLATLTANALSSDSGKKNKTLQRIHEWYIVPANILNIFGDL